VRADFSHRVRLRSIMAVYDQVLGGRAGFQHRPAGLDRSRSSSPGAAG